MKFLCVECDESMELSGAEGPVNGSMSVVFACRSCGRKIAMLTNPMETQMVHSLGVKVGGRKEAPPPMETIRTSLTNRSSGAEPSKPTPQPSAGKAAGSEPDADGESAGSCPFSSMMAGMMGDGGSESSVPAPSEPGASDPHAAFMGGNDTPPASDLEWTPGARERMERIPAFLRPMIERGIEDYARSNGVTRIDEEILATVRGGLGG